MNIIEFCDIIDKQLVVFYYPNQNKRFGCRFECGDILEDGMIGNGMQNGHSPDEAIRNFALSISRKRLVFGAFTKNRSEYVAPEFT